MFNDKYDLTRAVLVGRKTQTRRIPTDRVFQRCRSLAFSEEGFTPYWEKRFAELLFLNAQYCVGEEVAVAQSYKDARVDPSFLLSPLGDGVNAMDSNGWDNKMFVRADLMPHRIKITNIRVERLQDISEEDCLKEGFEKILVNEGWGNMTSHWEYLLTYDDKLGRSLQFGSRDFKEAFGILIDKTCGVGTWDSNPYVFKYDFEPVKNVRLQ